MKRIDINGMIISDSAKQAYDNAKIKTTSVSEVTSKLVPGEAVEVYINSIGGDVFAGNEIFTALKSHDADVNVKIIFAASIATVVAMAGKHIEMSPAGQFMIHNVTTKVDGDYNAMSKSAETLKSMNDSIINTYKMRATISHEEISSMMDKETWLNAEKAKEYGFIDAIMFEDAKEKSFVAMMSTDMSVDFENTLSNESENSEESLYDIITKQSEAINSLKETLDKFMNSEATVKKVETEDDKQEEQLELEFNNNKKLGLYL